MKRDNTESDRTESGRTELRKQISNVKWDYIIQFQPKSDVITADRMLFDKTFIAKTRRRRLLSVDLETGHQYSVDDATPIQANLPTRRKVRIGKRHVDATEVDKRISTTFYSFLRKRMRKAVHMICIVEDYGEKNAHSMVYIGNLNRKKVTKNLFIDAAKAAGLTIGCVNGKYLITKYSRDDAAKRQHFTNLTWYGSKSLSDKYLQTTKQLDSSSDVWWMSDSLLRTLFASQETSQ